MEIIETRASESLSVNFEEVVIQAMEEIWISWKVSDILWILGEKMQNEFDKMIKASFSTAEHLEVAEVDYFVLLAKKLVYMTLLRKKYNNEWIEFVNREGFFVTKEELKNFWEFYEKNFCVINFDDEEILEELKNIFGYIDIDFLRLSKKLFEYLYKDYKEVYKK